MRMVLVLLTSLRSFSSFWHGIARKRSLLALRASVAIKSTEKAATMSRVFCTFFPQKVPIAVCDWCCLPLFGRLLTAVFARGVLCTFWCQKYNKSSKRANKRSGIDNQAVFRFGSPCRSFRMGSRRHRRTRVRFPKRYLVRECLSFHKTVIFRLLHFCSS